MRLEAKEGVTPKTWVRVFSGPTTLTDSEKRIPHTNNPTVSVRHLGDEGAIKNPGSGPSRREEW